MKKTFPLSTPGKDDARVRDKIRHEVNKDVRRLRRRELPEGFGEWEITCKVGPLEDTAEIKPLKDVGGTIDALAEAGSTTVFIQITSTAIPSAKPSRLRTFGGPSA